MCVATFGLTIIYSLSNQPTKVAVANPFYDNIRQNLELSTGITERIPLIMPPHVTSRAQELPFQWLRDIVGKASARSADGVIGGDALEDLAMQFYRIELGEQRRLNGVMEHHTNESTTRPGQLEVEPAAFPYSITAGVEKGTKNRCAPPSAKDHSLWVVGAMLTVSYMFTQIPEHLAF